MLISAIYLFNYFSEPKYFNRQALCLGGHTKVRVPGATIALKIPATIMLLKVSSNHVQWCIGKFSLVGTLAWHDYVYIPNRSGGGGGLKSGHLKIVQTLGIIV